MYTTVLRLAWLVPSLWCYFVAPSEGVYGGDGPLSAIQFAFSVSLLGYEQAVAPCSYSHASTAWWTKATVQAWTKPTPASLALFLVNNLKAALGPTGNYTKSKCHHHLSIFRAPGWFMISNLQESKPSSQHPQFASVSQHELKTQVSTRNRWMSSQRLEPPQDIRNGGQQCGKRTALS